MKLAVTDASVFIDLFETGQLEAFFKLPIFVHTTAEIMNELFPIQQQILSSFTLTGQLKIHILTDQEWALEGSFHFSKGLSMPDKSVLMYAATIEAVVLSGDMKIRKTAKQLGLEYHGILWIFEQLMISNLIDKKEAIQKLNDLIAKNLLYKNSKEMLKGLKALEERISQV